MCPRVNETIVTFDPFDSNKATVYEPLLEKWKFAVGAFTNTGKFTAIPGYSSWSDYWSGRYNRSADSSWPTTNREGWAGWPGCSSMEFFNWGWDKKLFTNKHAACGTRWWTSSSIIHGCRNPVLNHITDVPVVSLSQFLNIRASNIRVIRMIKIDAQGSDFTIIKDLLENTDYEVRNIQIECQYMQDQAPTYVVNNDCEAFKAYMKYKRPDFQLVRKRDNCPSSEYNFLWHLDDYKRINVDNLLVNKR